MTETWLQSSTYSNEILPSGYICSEMTERWWGFVSNQRFHCFQTTTLLEVVSVDIFVLCLIYRRPPPLNCTDQHNSSLLSYLNSLDYSKNIIITGDMNLLYLMLTGLCTVVVHVYLRNLWTLYLTSI